ncbi:MAG: 50S ribosomal protein L6 [Candidatus Paceibacterota bacterium]
MSRIGKQPIEVPEGVTVSIKDGVFVVEGSNGTLQRELSPTVTVSIADRVVTVEPKGNSAFQRSMWGTTASHITNMIIGASKNFEKKLTFSGVGYRANVNGKRLTLEMGYSHDVNLDIPDGIEVSVEKNTITVGGPNKESVGQFAATVRAVRTPEPYKGSGIKYSDEIIRRKEGKKAV